MGRLAQPQARARAASPRSSDVTVPIGDPGGHIRGLDGLRAFAVVAVVLYHIDARRLPGGFLGVDVFFVISGFLITTLLLREIRRSGRVDLVGFWRRRLRRLIPAVVVLIVVVFPLARLVHRDLTVDAGRQILGALTFTTNWLEIWAGTSYFDQTAPHLLKNLWSLAIEEQFYWLWPILAVLLVRVTGGVRALERTFAGARSRLTVAARNRVAILGAAAVASMIAMAVLVTPGQGATRVYYGTDTHLFGLALGAAVAFIWAAPDGGVLGVRAWRRVAPLVGLAAMLVVVVLALTLDAGSVWTYRGGLQLANIATVVLLAAVITGREGEPSVLARVLEFRPLVYLGERSYGWYLWHWPIIVIAGQLVPSAPGSGQRVAMLSIAAVVSLGIAELSYRYVEQPVRRFGFRGSWARIRGALAAPVVVVRRAVTVVLAVGVALTVATTAVVIGAPAESDTAAVIAAKEAEIEQQRRAQVAQVARLGDRSMPGGQDITALGDSMVVTAKDGLEATFPGIDLNAKSVRRWRDGLTALREDLAAQRVRRAVVVSFGTNAGIEREEEVRELLDLLGPERMVVLMNIASTSTWVAQVNQELADIAADYPNVIVADWNAAVTEHPDVLQSDHIHPTLRGAYLYAEVVREAFAELSENLTGEPVALPEGPSWPL